MPSLFLRERPDVNVLGGRGCEHRPGACVLQVTVLDEPAGLSAGDGERCFERVQDRTVVSRRVGRVPQVADMRWRDDAVVMKRLAALTVAGKPPSASVPNRPGKSYWPEKPCGGRAGAVQAMTARVIAAIRAAPVR